MVRPALLLNPASVLWGSSRHREACRRMRVMRSRGHTSVAVAWIVEHAKTSPIHSNQWLSCRARHAAGLCALLAPGRLQRGAAAGGGTAVSGHGVSLTPRRCSCTAADACCFGAHYMCAAACAWVWPSMHLCSSTTMATELLPTRRRLAGAWGARRAQQAAAPKAPRPGRSCSRCGRCC